MIDRYQGTYTTNNAKKRERDGISPDLTANSPASPIPDHERCNENKREDGKLEDSDAILFVQFGHCSIEGVD